ncbi:MAG: Gfo/Idh/MocA family protein [Thermoguttaceae bacterium]
MNQDGQNQASRRAFLKNTGRLAAASALAGVMVPRVHATESHTIHVVLIGCGGRGTGAAANALGTTSGPIKLVAMADVFENRLKGSHGQLKNLCGDKVDVPADRQFIGFDGYRKAMDCLKTGDVAIFATPPAFRWVHFGYAIQKGLNVFMEKPTTVDGPTTRKMLALAEESRKRNLKVGVGLMWRHSKIRREVKDRIQSGQIGEVLAMRSYRMHGPAAFFESAPKPAGISDLLYQIQRFHSFLWASGGCFSDFNIHNIDECCWMKDAWPVKAQASGGRHFRGNSIDQNFDNYSVEYTFADGTKFFFFGRCITGCYEQFDSSVHGTKGLASLTHGSIYKGQNPEKTDLAWKSRQSEDWGYGTEWEDLVQAIREDKPYNEAQRGAQASLVTSMGRMAAHTGQEITYDQILNLEHEFAPQVDKLTFDSAAPLLAGPDGKYPVPEPGITKQREY